jgi:anti-sigma regulatory factor (Ser/Thr protein kinase)
VNRRDLIELAVAAVLVVAAGTAHFADAPPVLTFVLSALAIAILARLVGRATEQLGSRVGSSAAGAIQSGLGNLPELFIALFALHQGLIGVVQSALVGSVIANGILVLGLAFIVGGLRNGTQTFDSPRARLIATLTVLAAAILAVPTLAHAVHTTAATEAGINLRVSSSDGVWAQLDRALFQQAIGNLVSNAIAYTSGGGSVNVTTSVDQERLTVSVRDTGCGIAPEHLPPVFDRFYRVDGARGNSAENVGLGLAIVKSVVTRHAGRGTRVDGGVKRPEDGAPR